MRPFLILAGSLLCGLSACASGNVKSASDFHAPPAPPVLHPLYDPYSPYGSAPITWKPAEADRAGTVVRPVEPSSQSDRPDYEHAPWATGAGASPFGKAGTF